MIVKQYSKDTNKQIDHHCSDVVCDCGCNVYHYEYNNETQEIKCICNACSYPLAVIKDEFKEQNLKEGYWK